MAPPVLAPASGASGASPSQIAPAVTTAEESQQSAVSAANVATTGWWVLVGVIVSIAVSGTRVAFIAAGIMSIATIYQLQQWVSNKGVAK